MLITARTWRAKQARGTQRLISANILSENLNRLDGKFQLNCEDKVAFTYCVLSPKTLVTCMGNFIPFCF